MLAQNINAQFQAIEINEVAAKEAEDNFGASPWAENIVLHHMAVQDFKSESSFDLIVCNPPFFDQSLKGQSIERNIALHNDALNMEDLVQAVTKNLSDHGIFYVLYPRTEMQVFIGLCEEAGLLLQKIMTVRNQSAAPPFRQMAALKRIGIREAECEELVIRSGDQYTHTFIHLLKNYYLHLPH